MRSPVCAGPTQTPARRRRHRAASRRTEISHVHDQPRYISYVTTHFLGNEGIILVYLVKHYYFIVEVSVFTSNEIRQL